MVWNRTCSISVLCLYLPGDSLRFHEILQIKDSVPQDCPPLQVPIASPACYLCFWPTGYRFEVSKTPSLCSINLLERLTELRKPIDSLDYWFITKDIKGFESTARWRERYTGQGPDQRSVCPPGAWGLVARESILVPPPGSSLNPLLFWVFMEASLHRHDWLDHWPLVIDSSSSSPLPGNQGVGWLVSLATSPHP